MKEMSCSVIQMPGFDLESNNNFEREEESICIVMFNKDHYSSTDPSISIRASSTSLSFAPVRVR